MGSVCLHMTPCILYTVYNMTINQSPWTLYSTVTIVVDLTLRVRYAFVVWPLTCRLLHFRIFPRALWHALSWKAIFYSQHYENLSTFLKNLTRGSGNINKRRIDSLIRRLNVLTIDTLLIDLHDKHKKANQCNDVFFGKCKDIGVAALGLTTRSPKHRKLARARGGGPAGDWVRSLIGLSLLGTWWVNS